MNSGCEIFDTNSWCGLDSLLMCVFLENYCVESHQPKGEEQARYYVQVTLAPSRTVHFGMSGTHLSMFVKGKKPK